MKSNMTEITLKVERKAPLSPEIRLPVRNENFGQKFSIPLSKKEPKKRIITEERTQTYLIQRQEPQKSYY